MNEKNSLSNLTSAIALLITSIIVIFLALSQQTSLQKQQEENTKEIKKEVREIVKESILKSSNYPDYTSLSKMNKVIIASNYISWTPNTNLEQDKLKKIVVLEKGNLAQGYIYIRASLDNRALTQWESVYMMMNWTGGHLFRPQSLSVPPSEKTELLYTFNYIPILLEVPYNEQVTPLVISWMPNFFDNSQINIETFISSLRPALLEEVTIYYQCIKNSDCLLTVK